VKEGW